MKKLFLTYIVFLALFITYDSNSQSIFSKKALLMGSDFEITIVEKNESQANYLLDLAIEEISRIEKLISSWNKSSQTSQINLNAGIRPIKVDKELFDLISRSLKVSGLSQGAFDISYASLDKVWYFDKEMLKVPSEEEIKKSVSKVGFGNIILDKKFLEWYLAQYYELNDIDDYELRIFDKDVNMLNLKSTQAIKIENDSYSIVESSTIEKKLNEKSDESDNVSKYEGATEE